MGSCRENASIWWCLFNRYPNGDWTGQRLFTRRFWHSPYLWHDSFGVFWNRLVGCRLFGHGNVQNLSFRGEPDEWRCFDCDRTVAAPGGE